MPFLLLLICRSALWFPILTLSQLHIFQIFPSSLYFVFELHLLIYFCHTEARSVYSYVFINLLHMIFVFVVLFKKPAIPQGHKYILSFLLIFS